MFLENGDSSLLCSVSPAARSGPGSKEWCLWSCVVKWLEPQSEGAAAYLSFASNMFCSCESLSFWVENLSFFCKRGKLNQCLRYFRSPQRRWIWEWVGRGMCQNSLAPWKIPLESQGVGSAIIIWFPNGEGASRNVLCLMSQYIFSPHWWIWESNTCHLEIIDTSWWSAYIPLMKFWILIESEKERRVTWEQYRFMDLYLGY